jgi:hypothetical protein
MLVTVFSTGRGENIWWKAVGSGGGEGLSRIVLRAIHRLSGQEAVEFCTI